MNDFKTNLNDPYGLLTIPHIRFCLINKFIYCQITSGYESSYSMCLIVHNLHMSLDISAFRFLLNNCNVTVAPLIYCFSLFQYACM